MFENVREVQPHVFFAVPRVWEKMYSTVMITLKEASASQRAAYGWAIGIGQQVAKLAGRVRSQAARWPCSTAWPGCWC